MFNALSLSLLSFKIDFISFSFLTLKMTNYLIINILLIIISKSHFQIVFSLYFIPDFGNENHLFSACILPICFYLQTLLSHQKA